MKQTLLFFFAISFLSVPNSGISQWDHVSDITPGFYNSALAWKGKIYFAGGIPSFTIANNKVQILDLETNTLTFKTLSVGRGGIMVAAHEGKLYFAGGFRWVNDPNVYQAFSNVDIYDIATGTFTIANLSVPRTTGAATVVGGKLYFAGGYVQSGTTLTPSDIVDIYDPALNEWSVAHLSEARGELGAATIGDRAYFCGGSVDPLPSLPSKRVDIYDAATDQWLIDSISEARIAPSVVAAGQYLVVAGGNDNVTSKFDLVDIYDTDENSWSTATLSEPRCYLAAALVGKKAYFTGGGNCNPVTYFLDESSDVVDVFDPDTKQWSTPPPLNVSRVAHACAAWADKIAVGAGWRPEQNGFLGSVEVYTDSTFVSAGEPTLADGQVVIFPNPASSEIFVNLSQNLLTPDLPQLTISDLAGSICRREKLSQPQHLLDVSYLKPGIYLLEIRTETGRYVEKIVIH
jgi:hypothetical protein